jgi:hypothetical protein
MEELSFFLNPMQISPMVHAVPAASATAIPNLDLTTNSQHGAAGASAQASNASRPRSPSFAEKSAAEKQEAMSVWSGFFKKTLRERQDQIQLVYPNLDLSVLEQGGLPPSVADVMVSFIILFSVYIALDLSYFVLFDPNVRDALKVQISFSSASGGKLYRCCVVTAWCGPKFRCKWSTLCCSNVRRRTVGYCCCLWYCQAPFHKRRFSSSFHSQCHDWRSSGNNFFSAR